MKGRGLNAGVGNVDGATLAIYIGVGLAALHADAAPQDYSTNDLHLKLNHADRCALQVTHHLRRNMKTQWNAMETENYAATHPRLGAAITQGRAILARA